MKRPSLQTRLALVIGTPLVLSGVILLGISYALVTSSLSAPLPGVPDPGVGAGPMPVPVPRNDLDAPLVQGGFAMPGDAPVAPRRSITLVATQDALVERTRTQLLGRFGIVLAISVAVAALLSNLIASRLLRALRRVTDVAQRVSRGALGERVELGGPRDEMRELADAFDSMLVRLDAVFNAQRRFIADASHELRTPLTAMRAEVEVLCDDPHAAAADVRASTAVLRRQLACSEELIDALLALARAEPELLANEPLDLAELVSEALVDSGSIAKACGLRVETRLAPAPTSGDRRLLRRLAANLVSNALTHNHAQGWISVETTARDGRAVLAIANSGPVVTGEELAVLTQPFRRGGRARVGTGHGLGLSIVAAIARAHEGELRIENPDIGGLRVEIRLPDRRRAQHREAVPRAHAALLQGT